LILDAGCWVLDAGYWISDAGCWMLDVGDWMPDQVRHDGRTLDSQVIKKGIKKIIL